MDIEGLIHRVRGGDNQAFSQIVRLFQDMAVGYAFSELGDFHQAEDAAQESFLQAYVDLDQLRDPSAFPGWFRTIVYKHCDRIRRKRRVRLVELIDERLETAQTIPIDRVEQASQQEAVQAAIRRLPVQERAVTTLTYISGFTQEEIAAFLEVPKTTVNNRLYAARQRLKKELLDMTRGELNEQRPSKNNAFTEKAAEQITALRALHDALAAPVCDVLTEVLKDDVSVKVVSVNHTLCVEVVRWFRYPCCTYTFRPRPSQPRIFFEIDMELAACLVGRNIGRGDELRVVDVCQLAQEEMPGVHQVAKKIMNHVVKLWEGVVDMDIIEPELETGTVLMIAHPEGKQMEPDEPVFHVKFEVKWDGRESSIDLCYPAPSLAAGLARLQTGAA